MTRRAIDWTTSPIGIRLAGFLGTLAIIAALMAQTVDFRLEETLVYARYARNFGDGEGLVFNPGEHRNGTASYAYSLLLGIPALLGLGAIPQIAAIITALSIAGTCAIAIFVLAPSRSAWGGMLAVCGAAIYAAASLNYHALGVETAPALLLLTAALALARTRAGLAGLAAGSAIALRPELAGFAVAIAGFTLARDRAAGVRLAATTLAAFVPWVVFSVAYYGSLLPDSFGARRDQSESGFFGPGNLFSFSARQLLSDLYLPWAVLALAGVVAFAVSVVHALGGPLRWGVRATLLSERRTRDLVWTLSAGVVVTLAIPAALDSQANAATMLPIVWALALVLPAAASLATRIASDLNFASVPIAKALAVVAVGTVAAGSLVTLGGLPTGRDEGAVTVARWLRANAGESCTVATTEPGYLGWYAPECRVIDTTGLLTDGLASALARGDTREWLTTEPPPYVMINSPHFSHEKGAVQAALGGMYVLLPEPRPTGRLLLERAPGSAAAGSLLGSDVGGGSPNLNENLFSVSGEVRPGLFMHAAGEHTYRVTPRPGERFEAYLGMADGADRSSGVTFRVDLRGPGGLGAMLLREVLTPGTEWLRVSVEIPDEFAGEAIELTLSTDTAPGGTTDFGWAVWGEPRLGPASP